MTQQPYPPAGRAQVPGPGRASGQEWASGRSAVPAAPRGPAAPPPPRGRGGSSGPGPAGPGGSGPAGPGGPALVGRSRRRRWPRVLLAVFLSLLLVLGLGAGGLYFYARQLENNLARTEAFAPITGERPAAATNALNILVLGSDSRDPDATDEGYRADTLMLLHVPAARDETYIISIPRDLWVPIPVSPDGTAGGHDEKINAATAFGGVPLSVMTVESYTGVRIDHVMMLDFAGFVEVTDALGGVEMEIEQTIESIHGERRVFEEGTQELSGEEALDYIRQRYQFADGDFTRMRNQQQFLMALMDKATSGETLRSPSKLNAFLQATTSTVRVDEEFSLIPVAWKLRNVRGHNLTFLTSPHTGTGTAGGQSVVFSDDEAAADLYAAVREDRMAQWVEENPDALPDD